MMYPVFIPQIIEDSCKNWTCSNLTTTINCVCNVEPAPLWVVILLIALASIVTIILIYGLYSLWRY